MFEVFACFVIEEAKKGPEELARQMDVKSQEGI